MTGFKPGDEVVCIAKVTRRRAPKWMFWKRYERAATPFKDQILMVEDVTFGSSSDFPEIGEVEWIKIRGHRGVFFNARCFRKVHRRDLGAWLKTAVCNTDHLDRSRRQPERAAA